MSPRTKQKNQKSPRVRNFSARNFAALILWAPGIFGSFHWQKKNPHKFLVLVGGGGFSGRGGGSANVIFLRNLPRHEPQIGQSFCEVFYDEGP